jgi:prepilin-type N-terminal cleavage/methylation domain-containing protein
MQPQTMLQIKVICRLSILNMPLLIYKRGFTLIETIIYLALFSIVIGGALAATTVLFEGAGRNTTEARLQEEGTFMLEKIAYDKSEEMVVNQIYLQGLTDPSIVVTANSSGFTLTTRTRQGRSVSEDFFATRTP